MLLAQWFVEMLYLIKFSIFSGLGFVGSDSGRYRFWASGPHFEQFWANGPRFELKGFVLHLLPRFSLFGFGKGALLL